MSMSRIYLILIMGSICLPLAGTESSKNKVRSKDRTYRLIDNDSCLSVKIAPRTPAFPKYPRPGLYALTNTCNWVIKDGKRINLFDCEVDGVANYVTWRMVEPLPGHFRFPGFERMMTEAIKSKKLLGYSILAGIHAPMWVYEEMRIKPFVYTYPNGVKVKTYLPWKVVKGRRVLNEDMLRIWERTVIGFSEFVYNHPHRDKIYYIAITGWPFSNGLELTVGMSRYEEFKALNWNKEASDIYIEYCKRCVNMFIELFPDIPLGLAITDYFGIQPNGKPRRSYYEIRKILEYALKRAKIKGATVIPMGLWIGAVNLDNKNHPLISIINDVRKDALGIAFEGPMGSYHSYYNSLERQLDFAVKMNATWVQLWHYDVIYPAFQPILKKYRKLLHR